MAPLALTSAGAYLRPHMDRLAGPRRQLTILAEAMARVLETTEDLVLRFLSATRAEYGSIPEYLLGIGVENAEMDAIRAALVDAA